MKKFLIGCNYWASNAGTEMWKNWDEAAVRSDLEILSAHGIGCMRVFPNWRDFQPIMPLLRFNGDLIEYRLEGERLPENPEFLDETMLTRFSRFCDICEEYHMELVVGLLTGWMSGRLFIPSALFGKALFTDPVALLFEQRFVRGMVSRFKNKKAIAAWDLGNECNCMNAVKDEWEAANWTGIISNAIRANDSTRPIVSGMHSLTADGNYYHTWSIDGQAEFVDLLTTHPYPYFVPHCYKDKMLSYRTTMHATCQTKFYSDIAGKPCLVEEIGTLGPMVCSNQAAADFMRVNLFSNWAHNAPGVMWWCANDQTALSTSPYTEQMCELELGMITADRRPKPVLEECKKADRVLSSLPFTLPAMQEDALCVLTQSQDQWGVAYMSYCLAKQAHINLHFAFAGQKELPEYPIYLLPALCGHNLMPRRNYLELLRRVEEGAVLYISNDAAILAEFEKLAGMRINDSSDRTESASVTLGGEEISFTRRRRYEMSATSAEVLAYDSLGFPAVTKNAYGKGVIYYVNFALESRLLTEDDAFDKSYYRLYQSLFAKHRKACPISSDCRDVAYTVHPDGENAYIVAVNHSTVPQAPAFVLAEGYAVADIYYGNPDAIAPMDACIFRVAKK